METLDGTWDVVIYGTGLPQSLLALSLSRSSKKVLHLDRNEYYGGNEAALSLTEADEWAKKHAGDDATGLDMYSRATVWRASEVQDDKNKLSFSRAYSLALAPQIIYARSNLLPALVSSRTHEQLDFQAVGSWFLLAQPTEHNRADEASPHVLHRVPGGREDIFQDASLDLRTKRSLMKFLRFVANYDAPDNDREWQDKKTKAFKSTLLEDFNVPEAAHPALQALVLFESEFNEVTMEVAVPRIARHLRSVGMFGPGFGAVLPKWGGLAEVAQVACRACAVGGGVYVLNKGISTLKTQADGILELKLSGDEEIRATWLVKAQDDIAEAVSTHSNLPDPDWTTRSISIVSSSLASLFPQTSEGGVTPAGAVIVLERGSNQSPVCIIAHSSDTGECPAGQTVLYASTRGCETPGSGASLNDAVEKLLHSLNQDANPAVLWRTTYERRVWRARESNEATAIDETSTKPSRELADHTLELPMLSTDLVLGDGVLEDVKRVWMKITGESEDGFMKFEARDQGVDEEGFGS